MDNEAVAREAYERASAVIREHFGPEVSVLLIGDVLDSNARVGTLVQFGTPLRTTDDTQRDRIGDT